MAIAQETRDIINAYVLDPMWFLTVGRKQPTSRRGGVPSPVAVLPIGAHAVVADGHRSTEVAAVLDVA